MVKMLQPRSFLRFANLRSSLYHQRRAGNTATFMLQTAKSSTTVATTSSIFNTKKPLLAPLPSFQYQRPLSSWTGRGYDLTADALMAPGSGRNAIPKVVVDGYATSGFDVVNIVKNVTDDKELAKQVSGILHMSGSIMAFPHACFLWKIQKAADITLESLAPIFIYRPKIEYLFIGTDVVNRNDDIPVPEFIRIREAAQKENLIIEKTSLSNAIGTFNLLNAEDRHVAVVLVPPETLVI